MSSYIPAVIMLSAILCFATPERGYGQINSDSVNSAKNTPDNNKLPGYGYEFSYRTASPQAQKLMKEDFFWSSIVESAPFGSDAGSDAAYGFYGWRFSNKNIDPLVYLGELRASWHYPYFDWNEMDTGKIKTYMLRDFEPDEMTLNSLKEALKNSPEFSTKKLSDSEINVIVKSSGKNMGQSYLLDQDNAIIGTAFAQLAMEGYIASDLKKLAVTAIQRQLFPLLINRWDENYQITRKTQLSKMLAVVDSCEEK
jgi:uncharacterized protein YfeS